MKKQRDLDVVGILLGVIIGIMIGYFVSMKFKENEVEVLGEVSEKEEGYIYLLQLAKFDNAQGALNFKNEAKNDELYVEVVTDKDYYYIYGGISTSSTGLDIKKAVFEAKGYSVLVKKEYLLDKANRVLDISNEYQFWVEGINNFLKSLDGRDFTISDTYYREPVNLEFFSNMTILLTIQNEEIKDKVKLQTYRIICENLG